jgi:hypothetical protein
VRAVIATGLADPRDVQQAIAAAVTHWAPQLRCAPPLSAVGLLRAICENETEGGARWCAPLHESGYCYGGPYYKGDGPGGRPGDDVLRNLTRAWGCSAHESWGPWQVLFITAYEHGYRGDPVGLRDPMRSAEYVVKILNRRLFDRLGGATLEDALDAWNTGQARDGKVNPEYVADGLAAYSRIMGAPEGRVA